MAEVIDIWLKLTGTRTQARVAIQTLGLTELLRRLEDDVLEVGDVFSHDVALVFHKNLMTVFGIYDINGNEITAPVFSGPHLMIRFISERAKRRAKQRITDVGQLPEGIERVAAPVTIKWFGSP